MNQKHDTTAPATPELPSIGQIHHAARAIQEQAWRQVEQLFDDYEAGNIAAGQTYDFGFELKIGFLTTEQRAEAMAKAKQAAGGVN